MSFQEDGILNSLAEPVQLFAINELFDVHSRLRDLVKALDRVEVADGAITLYPKLLDNPSNTSNFPDFGFDLIHS